MYTISIKDQPEPRKIIGQVGLTIWDQIHFILHPDFWQSGYATEALKAFLITLFEQQPKRLSITAVATRTNLGSQRVLEKCGFVPSVHKGAVYLPSSAEISEQEELDGLKELVDNEGMSGHTRIQFFRYVKP
jgi:hypothetical protein